MKVLFLDIDGVLNSADWYGDRPHRFLKDDPEESEWDCELDPAAILRLKKLMHAVPDLEIVISSTWRLNHELSEFKRRFSQMLSIEPSRVIDKTPRLGSIRGLEIQDWLNRNTSVSKFAIIDDDSDMGELMDSLFKTSWQSGIQDEHVKALTEFFNEQE